MNLDYYLHLEHALTEFLNRSIQEDELDWFTERLGKDPAAHAFYFRQIETDAALRFLLKKDVAKKRASFFRWSRAAAGMVLLGAGFVIASLIGSSEPPEAPAPAVPASYPTPAPLPKQVADSVEKTTFTKTFVPAAPVPQPEPVHATAETAATTTERKRETMKTKQVVTAAAVMLAPVIIQTSAMPAKAAETFTLEAAPLGSKSSDLEIAFIDTRAVAVGDLLGQTINTVTPHGTLYTFH